MKNVVLTEKEEKFIKLAETATVISLGIGNDVTEDKPRVEILGKIVIEYENRERAEAVWNLAIEQRRIGKGDF